MTEIERNPLIGFDPSNRTEVANSKKTIDRQITSDNIQPIVRLNPLNNIVFACIFQSKEYAGTAMLEFLNAILEHVGEESIAEIIDMKSEYPLMGESASQKYGRLDVRVKAESGRLFDMEIQIEKDQMNPRSLFCGARMGHDEFHTGTAYKDLPTVRMINITYFYVLDGSSHIIEPVFLTYKNTPGTITTDKFAIYHIQLPEFRKRYRTLESVIGNPFNSWLFLLDEAYKDKNEMEVLSDMTEGMKNFALRYNIAIDDPDLLRRYRMVEDGKRDVASQIQTAVDEASEKQKITYTKGFKDEGIDLSKIAKVIGLSIEEVEAL